MIDKHSKEWAEIEAHISVRLEHLHKLVSRKGVQERDADFGRGAIEELQKILSLAKTEAPVDMEIHEYF